MVSLLIFIEGKSFTATFRLKNILLFIKDIDKFLLIIQYLW